MKMSRRARILTAAATVAAAVVLACSEPDQPAEITVTPGAVTLDAIGDTKQLSARAKDDKGQEMTGVVLTWASSATNVATVDSGGEVTAIAPGTSDVTASAGGVSGTSKVTVTQVISLVEATSGAQQTGTVGQPLPQPLVVRVRDRLANAVPGAAVTFAMSPNGGTVAPSSGTTGADGQLSVTWTLGTATGNFQATASVTGAVPTAVFNAKANPGPANNLAKAGGDNQFGFQSTKLAQLVAVRVRDQYGNGVPSHAVQFTAATGNGTVDSAIAFSDTAGLVRSGWVMPSTPGVDTVELQVASLSGAGAPLLGSPVTFTAVAHNVRVAAVSPTTLAEGQSATLTGSGFDAGNTQNVVTIDGTAATVTVATGTDLTLTVPTYDCKPARSVAVQVTVGGIPAAPVTAPLNPALAALNLSVGQQTIITDPTQFCFQLGAAAGLESYLVGVQSTSEAAASLTPISLVGAATGGATAAPLRSPPRLAQQRMISPLAADRLERWRRYREAEVQQRAFDAQVFRGLVTAPRAPGAATGPAVVGPSVNVGDTVLIRVATGGGCSTYTEITTVARAKGTTGIFLEDVANPPGGYSATQFNGFSQQYDGQIYPADTTQFGAPPDSDGNGRIVTVVTKEVNKFAGGVLGRTSACDLGARADNPASNEGEIFYVVAPDPNGTVAGQYPLEDALIDLPSLLAHESVHVIQLGRRKAAGQSTFFALWTMEGQAVLGEEVVGHVVSGNTTGANYGLDKIITDANGSTSEWYSSWVVGLGFYFGWDPFTVPGTSGRVANAPWECTWLAAGSGGPCVGGRELYDTPWSLLRYISDRFGPGYAGGEAGLHQAIIVSPQTGFAMLQSITGVRVDSLLAQWAAMLYADDFPLADTTQKWATVAPTLSLASWNLDNVFYGSAFGWRLVPELRLTPEDLTYSSFTKSVSVRAGSAYYAVLSGSNRGAVAVKARDASGSGVLPSTMRYWIVRLQ